MIQMIISKACGKMIHEKKPEGKNLVTLSLESKTSAHTRMHWCHFTNFIKVVKILSLETIPLKSRVKEIYKNLFFKIEYSQNQLSHLSKASSPK
jgi:hypothetical protein